MTLYKEDGSDINLAICQSWYLDRLGVERSYTSCNMNDPYSPQHFIAVDGPFTLFRLKDRPTPPLSDDGSREFLKKQKKVTIVDYQGTEVEKRTAYLRKAEELECDAIIVLDSDEYIHPDYRNWKEFRWWLARYANSYDPYCYGIIFNIMSWIDRDYVKAYNTTEVNEFTLVPRVWHSPKNLEYYNGVHYWVRRKNSDVINEKMGSTILTIEYGVRIAQDSKLRSPAMLEARDNCNKYNIKHEDNLIKRYNNAHNIPYRSIYNMVFGEEKGVTKSLNPLLAVIVNHYIPEVIDNLKKIINVDKIYLDGFENREEALNKAREFFLEHEEYTNLIITSDLLDVQRSDINKLITKIHYFDILSGYSVWHNGFETTFNINEVHFQYEKRKWMRCTPNGVKYLPRDDWGLVDVKYTDMFLIGVKRAVMEKYEFDSKIDLGWCWDVTHAGYKILIDPNIRVPMAKETLIQSSENPTLLFEKRYVDVDSFMA